MRAKFINEKFREDSDPIHDMGIGMDALIKRFVENEISYPYFKEDLLGICAKYGKTEFVKYLLEKGYNVHANDDCALRYASYYGHTETVKVLLNAGADVHADDDYALRSASYHGHTEVVKILKDWIAKEKKSVNEKFTEDDVDPIHTMGIGAKIVYYGFYKYVTNYFILILTGKTFDIKENLKKIGFRWSEANTAWKYNIASTKEGWIEKAPDLFKEIEKNTGYIVKPKENIGDITFMIPGYDIIEYPTIEDGQKTKVYVKEIIYGGLTFIGLIGGGTYKARNICRYFDFSFNKSTHMWEKRMDSKKEIDNLIEYLKENNYIVIDQRKT